MKRIHRSTRGVWGPLMQWRTAASSAAVIVVVAVLAAGGAKAADILSDSRAGGIEAAITRTFAAQDCLQAAEATKTVRAVLDAQGSEDWSIESADSIGGEACVSAGIVEAERLILIIPADRASVTAATQSIADELMSRCLGRDEAIQFVSSTLAALGVVDTSIRTDGPFAYPDGQEATVRAHVAAGCYVYSGSGRDPNGRPVYFLSGPEA